MQYESLAIHWAGESEDFDLFDSMIRWLSNGDFNPTEWYGIDYPLQHLYCVTWSVVMDNEGILQIDDG